VTDIPTLTGQDIGQAEKATRAVLDALLAETATTFPQWVALNVLRTGGSVLEQDVIVRQMSHSLKIGEPAVLATLGELATLGLVTSRPGDPAQVELTAAGEARFGRVRTGIDGITERLYGDLPPEDLATAHRVLAIVTARANAELVS
jgi:hypothetical protein